MKHTTQPTFRPSIKNSMESTYNTKHYTPIITKAGNYDINNMPFEVETELPKHVRFTLQTNALHEQDELNKKSKFLGNFPANYNIIIHSYKSSEIFINTLTLAGIFINTLIWPGLTY